MTPIVYPASLPGPTAAPFQPAERRLLSNLPGPRQSRPMQRDRLAYQQVDFVFSHAECAIFEAWLEADLVRAGSWFASNWSQPQGGVGVRRFVGEPSHPIYYPTLGWHVSAQVEVRGRGMLPVDRSDPLWQYVVLLIQNGLAVDQSRFARALTTIGGIGAEVDDPTFPGGKSLLVSGPLISTGLSWFFNAISTPELVYGSDPVCIETMVRLNDDSQDGQIIYGDEHGNRASGILFAPNGITGLVRCDLNTPATPGSFVAQTPISEGSVLHLALQILPADEMRVLYIDGEPFSETGAVTPPELFDPVSATWPPSIGRMTGVEGSENFNFDMYRITAGVARYTEAFDPPTELFPTR